MADDRLRSMTVVFNRSRAADLMDWCGLDAIVASSAVNVAYLTGYTNRLEAETRAFMLEPGDGNRRVFQSLAAASADDSAPALIVPAMFAVGACGLDATTYPIGRADLDFDRSTERRDTEGALVKLLARSPWSSPVAGLIAALRDRGLDDGRVGVEFTELRPSDLRALRVGLPSAEIRDCTSLFRLLRTVKTQAEIERLRAAGAAAESAAANALSDAQGGATLNEVAGRFRLLLAEAGAEVDHFAWSPRGTGIAMHSSCPLAENEIAYVDYGCIRELVRSDSGLTFALVPPEDKLLECFAGLAKSIDLGAADLRPGARASSVWQTMRDVVDSYGIVSSPHGHGLGLEAREYPLIVSPSRRRIKDGCIDTHSDLELEAGMVVNLEASTFLPGVASLHVERSYVVESDGAQPLIPQSLDRLLVAHER